MLALREPRRIFGARVVDRAEPAAALLDLALARFWERDARGEAVDTLETVTRRVHGEYVRKLAGLEAQLAAARATPAAGVHGVPPTDARDAVEAERRAAQQGEAVRRADRRAEVLEQQLARRRSRLEQAQASCTGAARRCARPSARSTCSTACSPSTPLAHDPRQLVDELLALVGDDMQAQRCSLMLRAPEPGSSTSRRRAAWRRTSSRARASAWATGVAGRVAQSREPVLVRDVRDAGSHPLLSDQYFTAGSFISFPLVYHGELVGVGEPDEPLDARPVRAGRRRAGPAARHGDRARGDARAPPGATRHAAAGRGVRRRP
jgi:hypothetical protein